MILVDTDVWIECLRGQPSAVAWMEENRAERCVVPFIVAMELVAGSRDQRELQRIQKFLATFEVLWPEPAELELALSLLSSYKLKFGIGIPDCMIAAMAISRRATLFSFNLKHFRPIQGLVLAQPYSRT